MVNERYPLWNAVICNPLRPFMAKPVPCGIPWASLGSSDCLHVSFHDAFANPEHCNQR